MGIDPVTHSPRLDLLDLSSILSSSLCNPSLLNLSSLLNTQALLNPELLRLVSTILSLNSNVKQEHINGNIAPEIFAQDILQGNNQVPPLVQPNIHDNQFQNSVNLDSNNGFSTAMTTQAMQSPIAVDRQLGLCSNNVTNLGGQENVVTNSNIATSSTLTDHLAADLPENSYFQSLLDYSDKDFGFESVLSTPSSSTTPLNSSSTTNVNSSAEDERESYCSNLFKFEIPESLDISDFL